MRAAPDYPYPNLVGVIVATVREGVRTLEQRPEEPADFGASAVRSLSDLARIVGRGDPDDTRVVIWGDPKQPAPVEVTYSSVAHVAALLRASSEDYGSVEGRLQVASERGELHVAVYEPVWAKPVRRFIQEEMLPEALSYFRQRVEVYGLIRYRKDGQPVSIKVDEIIPFPDKHVIPTARSVHGILEDYP